MAWTPLDESIEVSQAGHLADHESLHKRWNNQHVQQVASNTTLDSTYSAVIVSSNGGSWTITLPLTSGTLIDGHVFVVKRSGSNNVTVACAGSDDFDDGSTSKVLASDGAALGIMSIADGTWYVSGERGSVV